MANDYQNLVNAIQAEDDAKSPSVKLAEWQQKLNELLAEQADKPFPDQMQSLVDAAKYWRDHYAAQVATK